VALLLPAVLHAALPAVLHAALRCVAPELARGLAQGSEQAPARAWRPAEKASRVRRSRQLQRLRLGTTSCIITDHKTRLG